MSPRFDDEPTDDSTTQVDIEYIRRMYERVIDWYKVSEAKAQLILAVNGVFVTIVAGALFGKIEEVRSLVETFGVDTWVFLLVSLGALVSAVVCATRCLWSRHGRNVRRDFGRLGVNPKVPATYRPEALWSFGHLAKLPVESAVQALRQADRKYEIDALTYNEGYSQASL